ncbi:MAG: hypothetical protein AAGG09_02425 [Pseudomonadota bacterium]
MTTVTANTPTTFGARIPNAVRALRRVADALQAKRLERKARMRIDDLDDHILRDIGFEPRDVTRPSDFLRCGAPCIGRH